MAASVIIKSRTEREDNDVRYICNASSAGPLCVHFVKPNSGFSVPSQIEKVLVCQDQIDLILDDLGRCAGMTRPASRHSVLHLLYNVLH